MTRRKRPRPLELEIALLALVALAAGALAVRLAPLIAAGAIGYIIGRLGTRRALRKRRAPVTRQRASRTPRVAPSSPAPRRPSWATQAEAAAEAGPQAPDWVRAALLERANHVSKRILPPEDEA